MAKKAKSKKSAKKVAAKKAKKAEKKSGMQAEMITVKIPKATAKDPHPPFTMPVPNGPPLYCEWDESANKYVCK